MEGWEEGELVLVVGLGEGREGGETEAGCSSNA